MKKLSSRFATARKSSKHDAPYIPYGFGKEDEPLSNPREVVPGGRQPSRFASTLTPFIAWGLDNLLPEKHLELAAQSAIVTRVMSVYASLVVSTGLRVKDGAQKLEAELFLSKLGADKILANVANDVIVFNGLSVKIARTTDGVIQGLIYKNFGNIRRGQALNSWYYAKDWRYIDTNGKLQVASNLDKFGYEPELLPEFNKKSDDLLSLYVDYAPNPANLYYPLTIVEPIELQLQAMRSELTYYKSSAENSWLPGIIVSVPVDKEPDEKKKEARDEAITKKFAEKFKGARNAGKPMVFTSEIVRGNVVGQTNELKVTTVPTDSNDKRYIEVYRLQMQDVLIGLGVVAPEAFGIFMGSGFSSKSDTIITAMNLAQEYTIKPKQDLICRFFDTILASSGINATTFFEVKKVIPDTQLAVTTQKESNDV